MMMTCATAAQQNMEESTSQLTEVYLQSFLRNARSNRQRLLASMKQVGRGLSMVACACVWLREAA